LRYRVSGTERLICGPWDVAGLAEHACSIGPGRAEHSEALIGNPVDAGNDIAIDDPCRVTINGGTSHTGGSASKHPSNRAGPNDTCRSDPSSGPSDANEAGSHNAR